MTYSYSSAYITHLHRDHKDRMAYISVKSRPDDGFAIGHDSIQLPFVHEPHHDPFLHPSTNGSSNRQGQMENASFNPERPPVRTRIYGTTHFDHHPAGKPICQKYFDMFHSEIDPRVPCACNEDDRLAHMCIEPTLRRAVINELFRNPTLATVSNFASSHTSFKRLNKTINAMSIDSWKSGEVCHNSVADHKNLCNDNYTHFFYRNPLECIEFLTQQPALREHMSYAPVTEFSDAEEHF